MYPYLVLFLLQVPAPQGVPSPKEVPFLEDCSDSAGVLAKLASNTPVEVRFSMAAGAQTCYAITATVDGKPLRGYVKGNELAAIAEFERQKATFAASVVSAAPAVPAAAPPAETPRYPPFPDFLAKDMKGNPVSAHSLKGKVNLVCFWSPDSAVASRELFVVRGLYTQFKGRGLDALAVSLASNRAQLEDTVDDYKLGFRNVPSGHAVAAMYNFGYDALPRTYVLNERFEVIASGLHGAALESLVKKLMAGK